MFVRLPIVGLLALCFFCAPLSTRAAGIPTDLKVPLHKANAAGKLLLVDFHGGWCPWCVKMNATLKDTRVKALLHANFYYYLLDVGNFDKHIACLQRYGIQSIPFIIVFKPDGTPLDCANGYLSPADFLAFLQKTTAQAKAARVSKNTRHVAPADAHPIETIHPDLRQALHNAKVAGKLLLVDFHDAGNAQCERIRETLAAPEVKSIIASRYYYYKLEVGHLTEHTSCLQRYGIQSVPFYAIFSADASLLACQAGDADPDDFASFLKEHAGHQQGNTTPPAGSRKVYTPAKK